MKTWIVVLLVVLLIFIAILVGFFLYLENSQETIAEAREFYGVGWYSRVEDSQPRTLLKKASASGADFVIDYWNLKCLPGSTATVDYTCLKSYLDEANSLNLKVILYLPTFYSHKLDINGTKDFIRNVKNHPAIMGYYIYEEPDMVYKTYQNTTPDKLAITYNAIKEEDSKPVFLVLTVQPDDFVKDYSSQCNAYGNPNLHKNSCYRRDGKILKYNPDFCGEKELCTLNLYSDSADVLMVEYYPFNYDRGNNYTIHPYWDMERTETWTSTLNSKDKQFMAVVQGSYRTYLEAENAPTDNTLYPNKQQYRFYSIGNMISGSTGIINFAIYLSDESVVKSIIKPTIEDIHSFKDLFKYGKKVSCQVEGCGILVYKNKLGIVNTNQDPIQIKISFLPSKYTKIMVYENGERISRMDINPKTTLDLPGQSAFLYLLE